MKYYDNMNNTTKMQTVKTTVCKMNQYKLNLFYSHSLYYVGLETLQYSGFQAFFTEM